MSLRDKIINGSFDEDSKEYDDEKIKNGDNKFNSKEPTRIFDVSGIYSFHDCDHCTFRKYMRVLGMDIDKDSCWVDCTSNNYESLNNTFKFILDNTMINNQNAVLYTGCVTMPTKNGERLS